MRRRSGHSSRLSAAEGALHAGRDDPLEAEDARFQAAIREILSSMDKKHVRLMIDAGDGDDDIGARRLTHEVRTRAIRAALVGYGGSTGYVTPAGWVPSRLVEASDLGFVLSISVDDIGGITRPLAMPPAVAEVYLADALAAPGAECTECRYLLPIKCSWSFRPEFDNVSDPRGTAPTGSCNLCGQHSLVNCEPRCGGQLYFEECPLCSAPVGDASWRSEQGRKRRLRLPRALPR